MCEHDVDWVRSEGAVTSPLTRLCGRTQERRECGAGPGRLAVSASGALSGMEVDNLQNVTDHKASRMTGWGWRG
jgi:hypothetical protein